MSPSIEALIDDELLTNSESGPGWQDLQPLEDIHWNVRQWNEKHITYVLQMVPKNSTVNVSAKRPLAASNKIIDTLAAFAVLVGAKSELYREYIQKVCDLDIVQKIFLVEDEDETTILTIINAPPFEDSLREPIYLAQLEVLRSPNSNSNVGFHVLNEKELSAEQTVENTIPENAKRIWQC